MLENETKYSEFASRLNTLMSKKGEEATVTALSKVASVTYEMARRYTLGSAKPRDEKLATIAAWLGTTPAYLDYGVGLSDEEIKDSEKVTMLETRTSANPSVFATSILDTVRSIEIAKSSIFQLFGRHSLENIKMVNASDNSMLPTFQQHDLLFIDTEATQFNGDGIYAFIFEGTFFIKRLQRVKGNQLAVLSDNNAQYQPFYIEEFDIASLIICGKVINCLPLTLKNLR